MEWELRVCMSNNTLVAVNAAGLETTLGIVRI